LSRTLAVAFASLLQAVEANHSNKFLILAADRPGTSRSGSTNESNAVPGTGGVAFDVCVGGVFADVLDQRWNATTCRKSSRAPKRLL
jgi:hypothetical protein